jgi:hypothetical protein
MKTLTYSDIFTRSTVKRKFHEYLNEFHIKSKNNILDHDTNPLSNKEKIFLASIRDYVSFVIDLDLLISIMGIIWIIDENTFDSNKQTKIEELAFKSLDIQWCLRTEPEKNISQLSELLKYFELNKYKIT